MDDDSGIGWIIVIIILFSIIGTIIYLMTIAAAIIGSVAGVAGLAWGGGSAVKNYFSSFKENVVDNNKK